MDKEQKNKISGTSPSPTGLPDKDGKNASSNSEQTIQPTSAAVRHTDSDNVRQAAKTSDGTSDIDPTELELAPTFFYPDSALSSQRISETCNRGQSVPSDPSRHQPEDSMPDAVPTEEFNLTERIPACAVPPNRVPMATQTADKGRNTGIRTAPLSDSPSEKPAAAAVKFSAIPNKKDRSEEADSIGACGGFWKSDQYTEGCNWSGCLHSCESDCDDPSEETAEPIAALGHSRSVHQTDNSSVTRIMAGKAPANTVITSEQIRKGGNTDSVDQNDIQPNHTEPSGKATGTTDVDPDMKRDNLHIYPDGAITNSPSDAAAHGAKESGVPSAHIDRAGTISSSDAAAHGAKESDIPATHTSRAGTASAASDAAVHGAMESSVPSAHIDRAGTASAASGAAVYGAEESSVPAAHTGRAGTASHSDAAAHEAEESAIPAAHTDGNTHHAKKANDALSSGSSDNWISQSTDSHPEVQETEKLRAEIIHLRAELEIQKQISARYARDCEEFRQLYPDIPLSALPESIWEEVRQGVPLPAAYALAERRRLRTQEIAQQSNRLNRMRSAGSAGQPPSSYFSPDEVRAMSAEEVRQNYRTILQSMQKWS